MAIDSGVTMKVDFPGLIREPLPSGAVRYRVRVEGKKASRITLNVTPDHPRFREHYHAARQGVQLPADPESPEDAHIRGSLGWLCAKRLADMERRVGAGLLSPRTLRKREQLFAELTERHGEMAMAMPRSWIIKIRDERMATPAWADAMVEAVRELYAWAVDDGTLPETFMNPARDIRKIDPGRGGAVPWTPDDLRKYRDHHGPGSMPYLALTVLMFTAARIGDARILGRQHEFERDGIRAIGWQPEKRGSSRVEIPMLPPLWRATRAMKVLGPSYILKQGGSTYGSADSLSAMFIRWCRDAGLAHRSAHGVRKAVGSLLAEEGVSQYHIMSVHGHADARTSETYTRGAQRWKMAVDAVRAMESLPW